MSKNAELKLPWSAHVLPKTSTKTSPLSDEMFVKDRVCLVAVVKLLYNQHIPICQRIVDFQISICYKHFQSFFVFRYKATIIILYLPLPKLWEDRG